MLKTSCEFVPRDAWQHLKGPSQSDVMWCLLLELNLSMFKAGGSSFFHFMEWLLLSATYVVFFTTGCLVIDIYWINNSKCTRRCRITSVWRNYRLKLSEPWKIDSEGPLVGLKTTDIHIFSPQFKYGTIWWTTKPMLHVLSWIGFIKMSLLGWSARFIAFVAKRSNRQTRLPTAIAPLLKAFNWFLHLPFQNRQNNNVRQQGTRKGSSISPLVNS